MSYEKTPAGARERKEAHRAARPVPKSEPRLTTHQKAPRRKGGNPLNNEARGRGPAFTQDPRETEPEERRFLDEFGFLSPKGEE